METVFSVGPSQGYITRRIEEALETRNIFSFPGLIYIYIYKTNTSFINKEDQRKEKNKGLDIEQIYGHGSQRGPMPGVSVPAGCRQ
jgi:hypothetical protein